MDGTDQSSDARDDLRVPGRVKGRLEANVFGEAWEGVGKALRAADVSLLDLGEGAEPADDV